MLQVFKNVSLTYPPRIHYDFFTVPSQMKSNDISVMTVLTYSIQSLNDTCQLQPQH